jgi:orotate phosphoribosyltransferase
LTVLEATTLDGEQSQYFLDLRLSQMGVTIALSELGIALAAVAGVADDVAQVEMGGIETGAYVALVATPPALTAYVDASEQQQGKLMDLILTPLDFQRAIAFAIATARPEPARSEV